LIDNDYYPMFLGVDGRYLEGSSYYNGKHIYCGAYLLGYNDEERIYSLIRYGAGRLYTKYTASWDSLRRSLDSAYVLGDAILKAYKVDEKYGSTELSVSEILKNLKGYLAPSKADGRVFGVNVYGKLEEHIDDARQSRCFFDRRLFRQIKEHKLCMHDSVNYLVEKEKLPEEFWDCFKTVSDKANVLHNLSHKYSVTKNTAALNRIGRMVGEIREDEEKILNEIIRNLV